MGPNPNERDRRLSQKTVPQGHKRNRLVPHEVLQPPQDALELGSRDEGQLVFAASQAPVVRAALGGNGLFKIESQIGEKGKSQLVVTPVVHRPITESTSRDVNGHPKTFGGGASEKSRRRALKDYYRRQRQTSPQAKP